MFSSIMCQNLEKDTSNDCQKGSNISQHRLIHDAILTEQSAKMTLVLGWNNY